MSVYITISEAAKNLVKLNRQNSTGETLNKALALFNEVLQQTKDSKAIMQVLEEDREDDLPISSKTAMFEKLLELEQKTPALLRMYAQHLWLHGPSNDKKVLELKTEADALEQLNS